MDSVAKTTDTLYVVKEEREFCYLYDRDDPIELYRALFQGAESGESEALSREEVFEVIEGLAPERLRSI